MITNSAVLLRSFLLVILAGLPVRPPATEYGFRLVNAYPHDRTAFTQGLEYRDGFLYESTGLVGHSTLRRVTLETGAVQQIADIPQPFFAEGITVLKNEIFQLTWQHHTGFVYDRATFKLLRRFAYAGEGCGLANSGKQIFLSDGSSEIRVLDPASLKELRRLNVRDGAHPITELNELEFVRGELFANVWHTDRIARMSPTTGMVTGWIDLIAITRGCRKFKQGVAPMRATE